MKVIGVLALIFLGAGIIYVASVFGRPYWTYKAFKSDIEVIMAASIKDEAELQKTLMQKAGEYGLNVLPEDITISGMEGKYIVKINWTETVSLYTQDMHFTLEAGR